MIYALCDCHIKIDRSMERSLVFKRQIGNATAKHQSELKNHLIATKHDKNY